MKKRLSRSCCGGKSWVYELDKPINKNHLTLFLEQGFTTANHFANSGIFHVQKKYITASASFGTKRMSVRFAGPEEVMTDFDILVNKIINESV